MSEEVNQVIYGDEVLIDLTSDTVTEDTLIEGVTAHAASGAIITGTLGVATTETNGLLSADDKIKIDNLPTNTNESLAILLSVMIHSYNSMYEDVNPSASWIIGNGLTILRKNSVIVAGPVGPIDTVAAEYPAVFLSYADGTFTAHVYQYDEDTGVINELTDAEIFPFGCLKWYINPDFDSDTTTCVTTSGGAAYTSSTWTPAADALNDGDIVVCRLEY